MGFTVFLGLAQVLHWHHCRRAAAPCRRPLTYLILIGDGLHVPFAAGNFLYIGASDLVPDVNKHRDMTVNLVHLGAFVASVALMWMIRAVLSH